MSDDKDRLLGAILGEGHPGVKKIAHAMAYPLVLCAQQLNPSLAWDDRDYGALEDICLQRIKGLDAGELRLHKFALLDRLKNQLAYELAAGTLMTTAFAKPSPEEARQALRTIRASLIMSSNELGDPSLAVQRLLGWAKAELGVEGD